MTTRTRLSQKRANGRAVLLVLYLCACDIGNSSTDGRSGAVVSDSAGVVLVRNKTTGTWTEQTSWLVQEELRIGDEHDSVYQFGAISSMDVDTEGNIHVLDASVPTVRVFDDQGRFVRTIGRAGGGPGEFTHGANEVRVASGDTIIVAEMMERRIGAFSASGAVYGTSTVPWAEGIPTRWDRLPHGHLVHQARVLERRSNDEEIWNSRDLLVMRSPSGQLIDTILELPGSDGYQIRGGAARMRVFAPEPVWAVLADGRIAVASSDSYEIRVHEGSTLRMIISAPVERVAITGSELAGLRDFYATMFRDQGSAATVARQQADALEFNDHYPVISDIAGGPDGTIWVQRSQSGLAIFGFGNRSWDVFDSYGVFLGAIILPERFRPMRHMNGALYGMVADELGVQHVIKLRVMRPGNQG